MSNVHVRPEQVEKAVMKALAQYGDESSKKLEQITKKASRDTARALKATAPTGGDYARGWSHKATDRRAYKLTHVTYNRTRYMLIHLLERPHRTGPGGVGQYPKNVDYTGTMKRIEEEQTNRYYEEVLAKL